MILSAAGQPSVLECSSRTSSKSRLSGWPDRRNSRVSCRSNRSAAASTSNN